jgi:hypothetical protein
MAQKKFDGVVEAVRYSIDGSIILVRLFERRGAAFSDHVLMSREDLMRLLKGRHKLVTGTRVEFMAGTFETKHPIITQGVSGKEIILTQGSQLPHDWLQDVPLF